MPRAKKDSLESIKKKPGATRSKAKAEGRTEPVTVRISPTVKWALELMSRQMHMPISNVFEWCVDVASRMLDHPTADGGGGMLLREIAVQTAQQPAIVRAILLSEYGPSLLTHEERALADAIKRSPELQTIETPRGWPHPPTEPIPDLNFIYDNADAILDLATESAKTLDRAPITRKQVSEWAAGKNTK